MRWLYHIVRRGGAAIADGGFIHASFHPDVAESARLYFPVGAALEVLQIDPRRVRVEVVETPRGPMPHIMTTPLPDGAVVARLDLADLAEAPDQMA